MYHTLLKAFVVVALFSFHLSAATIISGSGSTLVAPMILRWSSDFHHSNPQINIDYYGNGSGAGIQQFLAGITDFAATDIPLHIAKNSQCRDDIIEIPMIASPIVFIYNLPRIHGKIYLSRSTYIAILLGHITTWSDAAIVKENPSINLPDLPIIVVSRSDGSGSTFVLTEHCSAISNKFKEQVGVGKSVSWPVGVAGKGNDGVISIVKQNPGAIGYVDFIYACINQVDQAILENKAGNFIAPSLASATTTIASLNRSSELYNLLDPQGFHDYPIVAFAWILMRKHYVDTSIKNALKSFFHYALTTGQSEAIPLNYIALPTNIANQSLQQLEIIK